MDKPQPGREHARLERLIGSWTGDNTLHQTAWTSSGTARASFDFRRAVDGLYVVCDYRETGGMNLVGLGVIGFDKSDRVYTLHWFDNLGAPPAGPGRGTFSGDTIAFEHELATHLGRTVFVLGDDALGFRVEMKRPEEEWHVAVDGHYQRVEAREDHAAMRPA